MFCKQNTRFFFLEKARTLLKAVTAPAKT